MKRIIATVVMSITLMLCLAGCTDAAAELDSRIANIGEVTIDSMEALELIEADYQALSDEDKQRVTSHDALLAAIDECEKLITDAEFLVALESSILSRMENGDSTDQSTLVETELAYLEKYRDAEFSDSRIAELAALYISGVDKQKEALKHIDVECEYQVMWQDGVVDRYAALKSLNEEYGLLSENAEFVGTYVNGYERQKFIFDAINAIEADIGAQLEADTWKFDGNGSYEVHLTYQNNTDYSFTSIFRFYFYTDDTMSTLLETTEAYVDVQPNSTYVVNGYHSVDGRYWCTWMNYYDMTSFA